MCSLAQVGRRPIAKDRREPERTSRIEEPRSRVSSGALGASGAKSWAGAVHGDSLDGFAQPRRLGIAFGAIADSNVNPQVTNLEAEGVPP